MKTVRSVPPEIAFAPFGADLLWIELVRKDAPVGEPLYLVAPPSVTRDLEPTRPGADEPTAHLDRSADRNDLGFCNDEHTGRNFSHALPFYEKLAGALKMVTP